jgi:hypothetical protein
MTWTIMYLGADPDRQKAPPIVSPALARAAEVAAAPRWPRPPRLEVVARVWVWHTATRSGGRIDFTDRSGCQAGFGAR